MNASFYRKKLYDLLALEYNCSADDFLRSENILTESTLLDGRRRYTDEKYFFHMTTSGGNAVVTANACLHSFLSAYIKDRPGHFLFERHNLRPLEKELNRFGYTLSDTYHMFLPTQEVPAKHNYNVRWFYDDEILPFYGDERFPNAICSRPLPERPDRIVVCAYDGDDIMGMAGCSEDAPHWMQIGIDVMPAYRSRGVGTYLVTLLKKKIAANGDIPFYGTSVANEHSRNIAINCGFRPAWVEIGAERFEV